VAVFDISDLVKNHYLIVKYDNFFSVMGFYWKLPHQNYCLNSNLSTAMSHF